MDVATIHTLSFVLETIGREPRRILEVGCGEGRLARSLVDRGHTVVAIDENPEAISFARDLGVTARLAAWPDGEVDGHFDAVLFTRSLHHVSDLEGSIERARDVLQPDGFLIVEDFDWHGASRELIAWFVSELRNLAADDRVEISHEFPWTLVPSDDPVETWRADHRRDLHTAESMERAIEAQFSVEVRSETPYLFRYLGDRITNSCERRTVQERILNGEMAFSLKRDVSVLGRRWVARKRFVE